MPTQTIISPLNLSLTVMQNSTVLPRCLQVLSRRGYVLCKLDTIPMGNGQAQIHMTVIGDATKHQSIPGLLARLIDVVEVKEITSHE
jgi:acetolactate synthase regulatory subunit